MGMHLCIIWVQIQALHLSIARIAVIGVSPESPMHGMSYSMPSSLNTRLLAPGTHHSLRRKYDGEETFLIKPKKVDICSAD